MSKVPDRNIGGLVVVDLIGYSGRGPELVHFAPTATGLRVTITGELAMALQINGVAKSDIAVRIT